MITNNKIDVQIIGMDEGWRIVEATAKKNLVSVVILPPEQEVRSPFEITGEGHNLKDALVDALADELKRDEPYPSDEDIEDLGKLINIDYDKTRYSLEDGDIMDNETGEKLSKKEVVRRMNKHVDLVNYLDEEGYNYEFMGEWQ